MGKKLADTAVITAFSAAVFLDVHSLYGPVIRLLLTIIVISFQFACENKKIITAAEIIYALICIPLGCGFMPAVCCSIIRERRAVSAVFLSVSLVYCCIFCGSIRSAAVIIGLTALSAVLSLRTASLIEKENELIRLRDSDTELTNSLREKNRLLLDRQDYEVNLAMLTERNRIAREIHDNVGHMLSRSLLQTGAMLAVIDKNDRPSEYESLCGLKDTLDSAMNSIRESVHGLRYESIDLHHAVTEAASAMKERYDVNMDLDFSENMAGNVKLCFISVVKEAFSNIIRHSNADRISVVIREHPALYQLSVTDNGTVKYDSVNFGMGLGNMRERTENIGGLFRIDTEKGFRIFISVKKDYNGGNRVK